MKLIILFIFCWYHESMSLECEYCNDKKPSDVSSNLMHVFCDSVDGIISKRCCIDSNNASIIQGLDLSNCSMHHLPHLNKTTEDSLQWLAINENPITIDSNKRFQNLTKLQQVVATGNESCINSFSDISWLHQNTTICSNPINKCHVSKCPLESTCFWNGPGASLCHCNENFNSYRCLKRDGFPAAEWIGTFSAITVGVCIILRVFQHKGLKRGQELKSSQFQ